MEKSFSLFLIRFMLIRLLTITLNFLDNSFLGKYITLFYVGAIGAILNFTVPIQDWISQNGGYIGFIMYAIALDFTLGIIVQLKNKQPFDFKGLFVDLGIKLLAVFGFGALFEGVKEIHNSDLVITDYLLYTVRMMVFLFPVISASKKMSIITGGVFPPKGWFTKADSFNEDLDVNKLTGKDDTEYDR